jgi:hypothetical protein
VAHARIPPPPDSPADPRETHRLIRERNFPSVEKALAVLHEERSVGTLMIDISGGSVGTVRFREEQKIKFSEK